MAHIPKSFVFGHICNYLDASVILLTLKVLITSIRELN